MPSESKAVGTFQVTKTQIIGTTHFVFDCYEPSSYCGPHTSLMTIEGQVHGTVASRRLPADIKTMPRGERRIAACDAFREALEEEAYALILVAYPEAESGFRLMGSIDLYPSPYRALPPLEHQRRAVYGEEAVVSRRVEAD